MESVHLTFLRKIQKNFGMLFAYGTIPQYSAAWALLLTVLSVLLSVIIYQKKNKNDRKRIPSPAVNRFIATLMPLIYIFKNDSINLNLVMFQMVCAYAHIFRREGIFVIWRGLQRIVILFKPETIEPVLKSSVILDKGIEYSLFKRWLKEGLLTSKGNKWRYRRRLLTPSFHFRILDAYIPVFNEQAKVLANQLFTAMESNAFVDIAPMTSLCTLDIICETAMGKKLNAQGNDTSQYVQALHVVCNLAVERLIQPWLWSEFIFYKTSKGKEFKKNLEIMDQFILQVISERKEEKSKVNEHKLTDSGDINSNCKMDLEFHRTTKKRLALLDLLLDVHFNDPDFTIDDIAEEVSNFMFAGHDTTSSGLSWAFYLLGLNPEIQRKVQEELDDVLGYDVERGITMSDIKELKYLECVLKETRRLFPPVPYIARELKEDMEIDGYTLPKGTSCGILIYMLHRNPDLFPNPEVFDPDRFKLCNSVGRHPYAYVPFSAGPRNCIGQKFASFETVVVLATILRRFELKSVLPLDKILVMDELVIKSVNGLPMTFQPRKVHEEQLL